MGNAALRFLHLLGDLAPEPDDLDLFDPVALRVGRTRGCALDHRTRYRRRDRRGRCGPRGPCRARIADRCQVLPRAGAPPARRAAWHRGTRATGTATLGANGGFSLAVARSSRALLLSPSRRRLGRTSGFRRFGATGFAAGAALALPSPSTSNSTSGAPTAAMSPGSPCSETYNAGDRRRHFDRRLVGHHVDQMLVLLDAVADRDVPGDDLGLGRAFADIGQLEDIASHLKLSIARRMASTTRAGPGKYSHSKACG